jgi:hypothetical protein
MTIVTTPPLRIAFEPNLGARSDIEREGVVVQRNEFKRRKLGILINELAILDRNVTIESLQRAAALVGWELRLELV